MSAKSDGRDSEIRILVADDNSDMRDYVARHDPAGSEWFVYGNGLLIEPRDSIVAPMSSRADVFMDARRR